MERQAGPASRIAHLPQKRRRLFRRGAEFLGQLVTGNTAGCGEPHQNDKIAGTVRFIDNLGEFIRMIHHEMPNSINRMGGQNCIPRFDRMHVVCGRVGRKAAHRGDLRYRRRIEMFDPGFEERAKNEWMRIALHGIQCAAGKLSQELPCTLAQLFRMEAVHRVSRLQHGNHGIGGFETA
jgi:hypothetical protein